MAGLGPVNVMQQGHSWEPNQWQRSTVPEAQTHFQCDRRWFRPGFLTVVNSSREWPQGTQQLDPPLHLPREGGSGPTSGPGTPPDCQADFKVRAGARPGQHRPCLQHGPYRYPHPRPRSGHGDPTGRELPDWNGFPSPLLLVGKSEDNLLTLVGDHVEPAAHPFAAARIAWHCLLESSRQFQNSHQKGAGSVWVTAREDPRVRQR